jgi:hypothetical protein
MHTFSGRNLNVNEDGTVEMSADDQYLIPCAWTELAERRCDEGS